MARIQPRARNTTDSSTLTSYHGRFLRVWNHFSNMKGTEDFSTFYPLSGTIPTDLVNKWYFIQIWNGTLTDLDRLDKIAS